MNNDTAYTQYSNIWALVVEDNALSLIAVMNLLKELGISFKRNTTGVDVVQQARAMNPLPDVILLDLDLPYDDSLRIGEALDADPVLRRIPVLAMGGEEWAEQAWQLRAAGFDGFIQKPLPHQHFKQVLGRVLTGKPAWSASSPTSLGR